MDALRHVSSPVAQSCATPSITKTYADPERHGTTPDRVRATFHIPITVFEIDRAVRVPDWPDAAQ